MAVSIALHGGLILLFFFAIAWKSPYPPGSEYGIELNIGFDEAGSGDIQPITALPGTTPSAGGKTEENLQANQAARSKPEAVQEVPENEKMPQDESNPVKTQETKPQTKPVIITKKDTSNKENQPATTSGKNKASESVKRAGVTGNENKSTSQGDQKNATGDQGNPEGSIDARALYGTQGHGGGGGSSLDLAGWIWDFEPKPKDTSTETGRIVFEIKVNDRGELTSVKTLEKTVSPEVEKLYRESVESLTFSPLSSNVRPAPSSTGKITFIIKAK